MPRHLLFVASALLLLGGCSDDDPAQNDGNDLGTTSEADSGADAVSTDVDPSGTACRAEGDDVTTIVFENRCAGVLTVEGSDIEAATIKPGASACRNAGTATETLSAKRYWGYLGTDPGAGRHTLAEFTFNTDFNDFDWYNISHVDAHNLTMQIVPLDRDDCDALTCASSALLTACPEVGQFRDAQGELVACVSPDRDDPRGAVPLHFESCDEGYAWSLDDANGDDPSPVRACAGEDWAIIFCP